MSQAHPQPLLTRRQLLRAAAGTTAASVLGAWALPAMAARTPALEYQVNAYIQQLRRAGRIPSNEQTAWSVYDFTARHKLVSINENRPMQSASMIKPFLAQAYFFRHDENDHRYPYDELIRVRMTEMIQDSNNGAADFFINRIGINRPPPQRPRVVERVLKRHAASIFRQTSIVEYIPRDGRTYRNRASAHDYSRFLYAMWNDRLPFASEIKHYMGLPNRDRIQDGASTVPDSARLYHKTGSTAHVCGDMGILVAPGHNGKSYPYIFVGIIEKDERALDYGDWIRDRGNVIREVSDLVYNFMRQRYRLVA